MNAPLGIGNPGQFPEEIVSSVTDHRSGLVVWIPCGALDYLFVERVAERWHTHVVFQTPSDGLPISEGSISIERRTIVWSGRSVTGISRRARPAAANRV